MAFADDLADVIDAIAYAGPIVAEDAEVNDGVSGVAIPENGVLPCRALRPTGGLVGFVEGEGACLTGDRISAGKDGEHRDGRFAGVLGIDGPDGGAPWARKTFDHVAADFVLIINRDGAGVAAVVRVEIDQLRSARDPGERATVAIITVADDNSFGIDRSGTAVSAVLEFAENFGGAVLPDSGDWIARGAGGGADDVALVIDLGWSAGIVAGGVGEFLEEKARLSGDR